MTRPVTISDPAVRTFLLPIEMALMEAKAWGALARLYTCAQILTAYEQVCRSQYNQSQLDLWERRPSSGPSKP